MNDLHVLLIEDEDDDAALIERSLRTLGRNILFERVVSETELRAAMQRQFDIVIADYSLPSFTGIDAVRIIRSRDTYIPCIVVSGSMGEELAVSAMKAGAQDYILKANLARLPLTVQREIEDSRIRRDRAVALHALAQSERRYRGMFEQAAVGMAEADERDRFIAVNDALCEMLGCSEEELLGRTFMDITHPDDLETSRVRTARIRAGELQHEMIDKRYVRKDGSAVWATTDVTSVADPVTGATHCLGFMVNISGRKAAEDALRASEAKYRLILEHASDAIFFSDSSTRYVEVNPKACEMTGFTREELLSITIADLIDAEDLAERPLVVRTLQPGMSMILERRLRTKNGPSIDVEVNVTALADGSAIASVRDIRERKRAEVALRLSEERLRAMVENGMDVISVVDARGVAKYKSPSEKTVFGYEPEELIGTNGFDRIHPEDLPRVREIFEQAIDSPGATRRAEYRYRHKDGSWREVEAVGMNLLSHPAVNGVVITTRDITDRKRIQSQLDQAERLAGLGRLAATIAHEFNNIMMGIQPFAEVIRRVAPNEPRLMMAAEQISRSISRGKRITQDILRFTRPAQPTLATLSPGKWLAEAASELSGMIAPKCELVIEPPDEDLSVSADGGQIMQVVSNIVLNARDAMPGGGRITIRVDTTNGNMVYPFGVVPKPGDFVRLRIEDTGCGMTRETIDRIWEPLFTTKKSGTGLGLPVARQIIEKHGGYVFVESAPDEGTTFHIFLPRVGEQAASLGTTRGARHYRILVVDDEPAVARGIELLLQTGGHDVKLAATGAEARKAFQSVVPEVVILDIGLPDVNGVDLCRELRQQNPELSVIFSTANGDPRLIEGLPASRAVAFLHKPYDLEGLNTALERVAAVAV